MATIELEMSKGNRLEDAKRFMAEFVDAVPTFGPMPVSNVMLACDYTNRAAGVASRSFVFQEAVAITNGGTAPRGRSLIPLRSGDMSVF
jgi:hypothetical protein